MGRRKPEKLAQQEHLLTIRQIARSQSNRDGEVAEAEEMSYTAVSAYELGTREPDLPTLLQYCSCSWSLQPIP